MNRHLFLYAVAVTLVAGVLLRGWLRATDEKERLQQNQQALITNLQEREQSLDSCYASVEVLRLRCREYERLHRAEADTIRALGIRLRRVEAAARHVTATHLQLHAPLRDSVRIVQRDTAVVFDTLRRFVWRDPWVKVEGEIVADSVRCAIHAIDTLRQIVHRVPRRFLFFRWGTKAVRQEIRSSNPHTRLCYSEYLVIER